MRYPIPAGGLRGQQLQAELASLGITAQITVVDGAIEVEHTGDTAAVAAAVAAHVPQEPVRRAARRVILPLVTGLAGKRLDALTAAEVRGLLAAIAVKVGVVDAQGRVKEISEWF